MKTRKSFAIVAIFALLLPLIGAFGPGMKTAAAATPTAPWLMNYWMDYEGTSSYITSVEYTYSVGGTLHTDASAPTHADWMVATDYYSSKWGLYSTNEAYAYSNFGTISFTSDEQQIPATAAWVVLTSMKFSDTVIPTSFMYSMNGTDRLTVSNVSDIPANAKWAMLSDFNEGVGMTRSSPQTGSYSVDRAFPTAQSLKIVSSNSHVGYAKSGDTLTLMLQTDQPIVQPKLQIAGLSASVTGTGTNWTGTVVLSDATGDGELNVSAEFYASSGAPGQTVTATTDGSTVTKDTSPPLLSTSFDEDMTREDLLVFINAEDLNSNVEEVKWALGSLTVADFATQGESLDLNDLAFYAEDNGTYSVYARDLLGNEKVVAVSLSNIDKIKPTIQLTPSTTDPTGEPLTVKVEVEDSDSGVDEVRWSEREPQPDSPWPGQDVQGEQFTATKNGTYTVIAWDRAGNEAIKQIVISNILSTNANLAQLSVSNGQQAVALTPAFDPAQTDYQLSVANNITSISISAAAGEQAAVVSVNGQTLASGTSKSVNLTVGANPITVTVTAPLTTVKKTYTLTVTRAAGAAAGETPASSPPVSTSSAVAPPEQAVSALRIELNGKALNEQASREWVGTARTDANGALAYGVQATNIVETLNQAPKGTVNELILKRDPRATAVETFTLRLSEQVQKQLQDGQLRVKLDLGSVHYQLPDNLTTAKGEELNISIHLLPSGDSAKLLQTVSTSLKQDWQPSLVGPAFSFSTNMRTVGGKAAWVLTLPEGFDPQQSEQLAVFVENASGESSIQPGTLQRDAQGQATGVAVDLENGARAILLQAKPKTTEQPGYVQGVSSDRFAPNQAVTRAELAALLTQLSGPSTTASPTAIGASFRDLPQTSWAASSVARATEAGWMSAGADQRFRPNDALTRGELAVVLARWKSIQTSSRSTSFTDSIPSWASDAVAAAEQAGWIKGYADGSFRANQSVTRAEAVVILNRVTQRPPLEDRSLTLWADVPESSWASGDIRSASRPIEIRTYLNGKVEVAAKPSVNAQ